MKRLPIIATVSSAYAFALATPRGIASVWAPMLVLQSFVFFADLVRGEAGIFPPGDPVGMPISQEAVELIVYAVQLVMSAAAYGMGLRAALGTKHPARGFVIEVGLSEIRMVPNLVVVGYAFLLGAMALFFGIAAVVLVRHEQPLQLLAAGGALALVGFGLLAAYVRFGLGPVVCVAEGGFGFVRSWRLLRRNTWRGACVAILIFLPLFVLWYVAYAAVLGDQMIPLPAPRQSSDGTIHALCCYARELYGWSETLWWRGREHWLAVNALGFVANVLALALSIGASAFTYTYLTRPAEEQPQSAGPI